MSTKRPVTPGDLFRFRPVSDPQISADGSRVVYVVQEVSLEENKSRSALWLAPATGGAPRQLTNPAQGSDRAPRFSPDGTRIAFISDRKGKPQLWVIPADGGEATCLETKERPQGEPVWSPDGSRIAFTASVFDKPADWVPYAGAPESDRQRAEDAAQDPTGEPVKVISRLKFRMDGVGYYGDKRSHLFVIPADGAGPAKQVSSGDFDHTSPSWAEGGTALICAALRREDADYVNRSDLWRFDAQTGEATLLCENAGPVSAVKVSPDGRHLIFAGHAGQHKGSTNSHLLLLTLGGEHRAVSLTAKLDRPAAPAGTSDLRNMAMSAHQWAADSQGVYFLLGDRGESHLFYAPADGAKPTRLTSGEERTIVDFSLSADGTAALLIGENTAADEIYVLAGGVERRLTDHNLTAAAELELVQPERFTYLAPDGWPIDGWLMKPVGYEEGKRYPTVLSIHGGPHGAYGTGLMLYFQALTSAGFAVLYTNPRGSQTYGQDFALAVVNDWGGRDYEDIMAGVDAAVAMGVADPERLGVMGWSYGGFMTCWTVTHTERFKAAITGAPVANNYSMIGTTDIPWFTEWHLGGNPWSREGEERLLAHSSIRYTDRVTTPTMVVCGEGDLRCPISQAEEFYMALKRIGKAPTVQIRYPGEFHGVAKPKHRLDRYERTVAWFRYWLMK